MRRRSFLATILTLAAAPAIVRASSLMPVRAINGDLYDVWPHHGGYETYVTGEIEKAVGGWRLSLFTGLPGANNSVEISRIDFADGLPGDIVFPTYNGKNGVVTWASLTKPDGSRHHVPMAEPRAVMRGDTISVALPINLNTLSLDP